MIFPTWTFVLQVQEIMINDVVVHDWTVVEDGRTVVVVVVVVAVVVVVTLGVVHQGMMNVTIVDVRTMDAELILVMEDRVNGLERNFHQRKEDVEGEEGAVGDIAIVTTAI